MFENIEKALTIVLLVIGVNLDGEDEQVKKRISLDETMITKPSAYNCIPKYISGNTLER